MLRFAAVAPFSRLTVCRFITFDAVGARVDGMYTDPDQTGIVCNPGVGSGLFHRIRKNATIIISSISTLFIVLPE
jgi:hypothetical protein